MRVGDYGSKRLREVDLLSAHTTNDAERVSQFVVFTVPFEYRSACHYAVAPVKAPDDCRLAENSMPPSLAPVSEKVARKKLPVTEYSTAPAELSHSIVWAVNRAVPVTAA